MARTPDRRSFLLAAATMALAACSPDQTGIGPNSETAGASAPDGPPALLSDLNGQPPVDSPAAVPVPADAQAVGSAADAAVPVPADAQQAVGSAAQPGLVLERAEVAKNYAGRSPRYWGMEAPGVLTRLPPAAPGVALTFDFCGGPGGTSADQALLAALRQQHIPATLFLNSRWITANQALAKELAADPLFELANHGTSHGPLSVTGRSAYGIPGTRNPVEVYDEIMTNDAVLTALTGKRPRLFRPGTAHLDEVSAEIVRTLGQVPVGFTINGDGGATFPAATVTREISRARGGDIVICHGNHPGGGTTPGLVRALAVLKDRGETFVAFPRNVTA